MRKRWFLGGDNISQAVDATGADPAGELNRWLPETYAVSPKESNMQDIKRIKEASQDFAADFASLRDDITKLTSSVSELARAPASATASTVMDTVDGARQKLSDSTAEVQNRLRGAGSDIEAMIERNPLVAVLAALSAGLLIGMMSGTRK
jgi:ElaB/YqjD/DUF883 family membrane-anchored ribosome-binding protein